MPNQPPPGGLGSSNPSQQVAVHHAHHYAQQQSLHEPQHNAAAPYSYPSQHHAAVAPPPIAAAPVPGAPTLPPGWVAIVDPSTGRTYYGNPLTGDTSWEVPSLPPPPPDSTFSAPPPPTQPQLPQAQPQLVSAPASIGTQLMHSPAAALHLPPVAMNYLVPQVRSMMDAEQSATATNQSSSTPPPLELADLTAGAVADLINVAREQALAAGEELVAYDPIEPYKLPVLAKPPHIEPGRLEIRANLLYDKLEKL